MARSNYCQVQRNRCDGAVFVDGNGGDSVIETYVFAVLFTFVALSTCACVISLAWLLYAVRQLRNVEQEDFSAIVCLACSGDCNQGRDCPRRPKADPMDGDDGSGMITESDLYAIGMESQTGWRLMRELCERLGIQYPPEHKQDSARREAMADPLEN